MKWVASLVLTAMGMGFGFVGTAESQVDLDECRGLTCAQPGDRFYVPEASHADGSVGGPRDLALQTRAGFYEYSTLQGSGERAVAYVIPPGELESAPDNVRMLPLVASSSPSDLANATAVVFGPGALLVEGDRTAIARGQRPKGSLSGKRKPGVKLRRSADQCGNNEFCLFDCEDQYTGIYCNNYLRLSANTLPPAADWENLSQWNFQNKADSMVNNRNNDNMLARQPNGDGARYCADSHSEDNTFSNNNPGNNQASSVRALNHDSAC